MQRFGQPTEPLKGIDCNVTTGPHHNLGSSQFIQNESPMKNETICENGVKMDAVLAEPSAKEQAFIVDDANIPWMMQPNWTEEELELFEQFFSEWNMGDDPDARTKYLAKRIEERKKPKKRQRLIYIDALCEEIGIWPKRGRWDFDCLIP
jgi:hypothetical protein